MKFSKKYKSSYRDADYRSRSEEKEAVQKEIDCLYELFSDSLRNWSEASEILAEIRRLEAKVLYLENRKTDGGIDTGGLRIIHDA